MSNKRGNFTTEFYQIEYLNVYYKILFYVSSIELNAKAIEAESIKL
ncbi:hypothetical protein LEP1GSC081_3640 [Leptospira kirschneri str. H1]|uniref:Uncharacterized protein n=1 Tax=Leptospira kirschneri str. H1 TaxID=1049966 RepID=A0A0E2B470_9LEPT|nr:hypothetical protein LEP1GSC081_3640 [Leptospira kirschneri str. H1]